MAIKNRHVAVAVARSPQRRLQNQPSLTARPNTIKSGTAANSTPMQRVLSQNYPQSLTTKRNRQLLTQRNPFTRPLNTRTQLQIGASQPALTLNPGSIPPRFQVGTMTKRAASGLGVAPAPSYGPPPPSYVGIRNNALQLGGIPTIRRPIQRPPQGGAQTAGFQRLVARGRGIAVRPFVHK
jgi:hypothetical protein